MTNTSQALWSPSSSANNWDTTLWIIKEHCQVNDARLKRRCQSQLRSYVKLYKAAWCGKIALQVYSQVIKAISMSPRAALTSVDFCCNTKRWKTRVDLCAYVILAKLKTSHRKSLPNGEDTSSVAWSGLTLPVVNSLCEMSTQNALHERTPLKR